MTSQQIRRAFLEYFAERGHEIVASSSLVPADDPTLLFTNAGMNQFKAYFLGMEQRPYNRAVTSQKCVRAGGKHNDLENVGYTARHHTFFEMLGNFSFGDYFKKEAIVFGWEFLTQKMRLRADRLYATVYVDDDEAATLWAEVIGLPPHRIVRLGEKDNFWSMGDTGPCGPCSEIIIDRGEEAGCGRADCALDTCGCDRWLELWNLVFMQYDRDASGKLTRLPRPSIDTGMGLERIAATVQNAKTNFDTDLFMPVIRLVEQMSGKEYGRCDVPVFAFRIIADHGRCCSFLVGDGVMPSNEGRGYVLRRILRRAVRYGKALGIDEPFMHSIVPVVANMMQDTYPELTAKADFIARVIRAEEERFRETLSDGTKRVEEIIHSVKARGATLISGRDAFMLYDTYGFPVDLTVDMASESGLEVDREEFERAMQEQRERARAARHVEGPEIIASVSKELGEVPGTEFIGYDRLEAHATVLAILRGAERVESAAEGDSVSLILDATPFYAESGGQVSDTGTVSWQGGNARVQSVHHTAEHRIVHTGVIERGRLNQGDRVLASVDASRRRAVQRNHSATHLLHRALKNVLGEHVNQAGSLVLPERLRFDFTHFSAMTPDELKQVEEMVNRAILDDLGVSVEFCTMEEAKRKAAIALFGEKYGSQVRVVSMGELTSELCGGTHVRNTGQIGLFKIVAESGVGSGLRRIEAVTGCGLMEYVHSLETLTQELSTTLKVPVTQIMDKVNELHEKVKEQSREIESLKTGSIRLLAEQAVSTAVLHEGVRIASLKVSGMEIESMRTLGDMIRDKIGVGAVVIGQASGERVTLLVMASKAAVKRGVHAGAVAKHASAVVGGSGGGRPDMAQAGGRQPHNLDKALSAAVEAIKANISPEANGG